VLAGLAQLAVKQENITTARRYIEQSLTIYLELYQQQLEATAAIAETMSTQLRFDGDQVDSLIRAGLVFCADNRFERAATLFGAMEPLLAESGYKPVPPLQTSVRNAVDTIRNQLAESTFTAAWEASRTMSPEQIMAFALTP
jgi:hypothetical protein